MKVLSISGKIIMKTNIAKEHNINYSALHQKTFLDETIIADDTKMILKLLLAVGLLSHGTNSVTVLLLSNLDKTR